MQRYIFIIIISMFPFSHSIKAQEWKVESESAEATVTWKNGTCDIFSPMGLTLWYDHRMEGNTVIEYEAMIVADKKLQDVVPSGRNDKPQPRISDLNCFWMANSCGGCGGRFLDNYALCLYYMGYGGNYNTTTRFRRYNGDARGVSDAKYRPAILKEYTDEAHLLKANHWYKIRLEQIDGHIRYYSDGDLLVDYVDPEPLTSGYFGFRTTFAHARLRNFKYSCSNPDTQPIVIRNIHSGRKASTPITFGVPFAKSETDAADFQIKTTDGRTLAADSWRLASWPDGSTKWQAFTTIVPGGCDSILLYKGKETVDIPATANNDIPPFQVTLNHIMHEVTDADTLLYKLDPMRLAQPRDLYPCSAPARLRIGPDWLGYVSNWMTKYERGLGNTEHYKNKILTGMNSIASLRHGIFSGPKALGYYPDSGKITNECDNTVMNTNHLITIMGGFELINELEMSIDQKPFFATWLDHAARYKTMAKKITKSKFLIPRLSAYAGWRLGDEMLKATAWDDLLNHLPLDKRNKILSTNDCATWTLDAIFQKEVINK